MTPEGDHNISWKFGDLPSGQATPDLRHHEDFKEATAGSTQKTARRKELSEQDYRHNTLTAIAVCSNDQVQRSGLCLYYPT